MTTAVDSMPATPMQIERLTQLSEVVLGDPDVFFKEAGGKPYSRADAGHMLAAFHCVKQDSQPLPGRQTELVELITRLKADRPPRVTSARSTTPAADREETTVETKTCTRCGEDKPLDDFYKGQGKCKPCYNQHAKERKAKKSGKATTTKAKTKTCDECGETKLLSLFRKPGRHHSRVCVDCENAAEKSPAGPAQEPSSPPLAEPDPPLSDGNGLAVLVDPKLSDLRKLQGVLSRFDETVGLEETAQVADELVRTFGPGAEHE